MIKVTKPKPIKKNIIHKEFSPRGIIRTFSKKSRRRLMQTLGKLSQVILPLFATLTYPSDYPHTKKELNRHLKMLEQRFKRKFPDGAIVLRKEPQKRGAPHYHLLIWNVKYFDLYCWLPMVWCDGIVKSGDENHLKFHLGMLSKSKHCVSKARSYRGIWNYVSKYMAKVQDIDDLPEFWKEPGRFWTVWNKEKLPWAKVDQISITFEQGVKLMRLMRRFMRIRGRSYNSLTMFCTSNFWFERLNLIM